jgi:hypothetical protein
MPRRPAACFSIGDSGKPGNHGARDDYDTGVPRGAWAAHYPTSQSTSPRRSSAILRSSASSRSRVQRRELAALVNPQASAAGANRAADVHEVLESNQIRGCSSCKNLSSPNNTFRSNKLASQRRPRTVRPRIWLL